MSNANLKLQVVLSLVECVTQPFKKMLRGNTALMQSFKNTQTTLKALGQNQKTITSFRRLQVRVRDTSTALGAARHSERLRTLHVQLESACGFSLGGRLCG